MVRHMHQKLKRILFSGFLILIILSLSCKQRNDEPDSELNEITRIQRLNSEIQTLFADSSIENIEAYIAIIEQKLAETKKELKYQQDRLEKLEAKLTEKEMELQLYEQELDDKSNRLENILYFSLIFCVIGILSIAITIYLRTRPRKDDIETQDIDLDQSISNSKSFPTASDPTSTDQVNPDKD